MRSSAGGTLRSTGNGRGGSLRIADIVSAAVAPWNGCVPDSISCRMAPNAKRSDSASAGRPRTWSGDIYATVPRSMPGVVTEVRVDTSAGSVGGALSESFARPKSRILTRPLLVMKRFSGLRSRWTIPCACGRFEAVRDLDGDIDGLPRRHRPFLQQFPQRPALEQLRDDVRRSAVCADVVHREDVRMIECRGGARFLLEASQVIGVGHEGGRQHFDRHVAREP